MTELETLAIVAAVFHFDVYLEKAAVVVYTDHRACTALGKSKSELNPRLRRMALKLQGKELDIRYKPGSSMGNADGLSRQNWGEDDSIQPSVFQTGHGGAVLAGGDVGLEMASKKENASKQESASA